MQPTNGIQLYLELIDFDLRNSDDLIDRYILDLNITRGSNITRNNLRGIFNITELNVTFQAECLPGFTGSFCQTTIQSPEQSSDITATIAISSSVGVVALVALMALCIAVVLTCSLTIRRRLKKKRQLSPLTDINIYGESDGDPAYAHLVS